MRRECARLAGGGQDVMEEAARALADITRDCAPGEPTVACVNALQERIRAWSEDARANTRFAPGDGKPNVRASRCDRALSALEEADEELCRLKTHVPDPTA